MLLGQRLFLFVATALAIAVHMGSIASTQAATVPAAYRVARWRMQDRHPQAAKRAHDDHRLPVARRLIQGIQRRTAKNGRRNRRRSSKQRVLQADGSSGGSGSCGAPTTTATTTDDAFPTVTPATSTATTTDATPTTTQDDTTSTAATVTPATTTTASPSSTTSTSTSSPSGMVAPYPVATVMTGAGTPLVLQSNTADYGWQETLDDLNAIMSWAGDDGNLTLDEKTELVAALLSGSARFWPELPTRVIVRIMLADIRAESDFRPRVIGGERLDSGSSWGLLQLSPGGGAQMMPLFTDHFNSRTHNFTWGIDAPNVRAGVRGALIDWETGKQMDMAALVNEDLFRPWINVHAGMWIQSNLARMASADPWLWEGFNELSWSYKQSQLQTLTAEQNQTFTSAMAGAKLPRTPKTALGSWVAGAATNGDGSYTSNGDDISAYYFSAIMKSVSFLYNGANGAVWQPEWLDRWTVNAGLTDYL